MPFVFYFRINMLLYLFLHYSQATTMTFSISVLLHICGFIFRYYNQAITMVLPYSLPTYKLVLGRKSPLFHSITLSIGFKSTSLCEI